MKASNPGEYTIEPKYRRCPKVPFVIPVLEQFDFELAYTDTQGLAKEDSLNCLNASNTPHVETK